MKVMRAMRAKTLYVVFILSLFAVSSFAAEQMKLNGKYKRVDLLCSDNIVYDDDGNVLTSSTKFNRIVTMNFSNNEDKTTVVKISFDVKDNTSISGSYTVKYTVDADGEFKFLELLSFDYPKESGVTKEVLEEVIFSDQRVVVSVNKNQLIARLPGFDGFGRCTPPAFVINVYEKVFNNFNESF